jgi:dTDP-4-dehydrorhamnose reductase
LLGTEVFDALVVAGHEAVKFGHEFDVSDPMCVARIPAGELGQLDWVVNCAAYTAVDAAEADRRSAYETNVLGPTYLGDACSSSGVKLLHISTDFVFDGKGDRPYVEEDPTGPLNMYGETKLAGERALAGNHLAVVVRTSWLFGPRGKCFPRSMVAAADAGKTLRVVADQVGTPTYTPELADRLVQVLNLNPFPGVYHLAGPEAMSWHRFAELTLQECRPDYTSGVQPIPSDQWPTPATRPKHSPLNSTLLTSKGIPGLPPVQDSLKAFSKALP